MASFRAVVLARRLATSALSLPACSPKYLNTPIPPTVTRGFSLSSVNMVDPRRVVSYDDVTKYTKQKDKLIIDVRNPDEVSSTGKIPSSINIPLPHVEEALSMSDEQFEQNFQRKKPGASSEIIFYCRSGSRSKEALDTALKLGYSNSKSYLGSWEDWSSKSYQK